MAVQPAYIWTPQGQQQTGRGLQMHLAHNTRDLFAILQQVLDAQPHPAGPLAPEIIGIQSRGMERWLQRELAAQQGIVTNIAFPLLRRVLEASAETLRNTDANPVGHFADLVQGHRPLHNVLEPARLRWSVADMLASAPGRFVAVENYMAGFADLAVSSGDLYLELAERLARLLDTYCLYDPQTMLRCAEEGPTGLELSQQRTPAGSDSLLDWQYTLWHDLARQLTAQYQLEHAGALHPALQAVRQDRCTASTNDMARIRLHLFGFSYLPQAALDLLYQLAQAGADVQVYSLVVTSELQDDQDRAVTATGNTYREDRRNPLLSAMGQLSAVQAGALHLTQDYIALPPPADTGTLLARIQQDLAAVVAPEPLPATAADSSVEIHNCYSPLREVEALRDRIVHMLSEPDCQTVPEDILVMCPAIREYAPYIQAVFHEPIEMRGQRIYLPFQVAEQAPGDSEPHTRTLLGLLDMLDGRMTITQWLALLDSELVQDWLGLEPDSLPLARDTLQNLHVHWGLDAKHRQQQAGMADSDGNRHTMDYGLQRLALAQVLTPDTERTISADHGLWQDQAPAPISLEGARMLVPLQTLYTYVQQLYQHIREDRTPANWISWTMEQVLLPLLGSHKQPDVQQVLSQWQAGLAQLAQASAPAGTCLSYRAWLRILREQLDTMAPGRRFLQGGITFAHLTPIRTIPADTVALLGMDYTRFPRHAPRDEFDLLAQEPTGSPRWHPDPLAQDRHLFLEALMSTRSHFWVFYSGQDKIKNEPVPAAGPVLELQHTLQRYQAAAAQERMHPLHPFGPASYGPEADARGSAMRGVLASWYRTSCSQQTPAAPDAGSPWLATPVLPAAQPHTLGLQQVVRAMQQPGPYWLRRQLGLQLADEGQPDDEESFRMDALGRWQVQDWLVQHLVADLQRPLPTQQTLASMQAARGQQPLHRDVLTHLVAAHRKASWIQTYLQDRVSHQVQTNIILPGTPRLQGQLTYWVDQAGHRYFLQSSALDKGKYILQHWLYHLLLQQEEVAATHLVSPHDLHQPCMHFVPDCPASVATAHARELVQITLDPDTMALSEPGMLWQHWLGLDAASPVQPLSVSKYIEKSLTYVDAGEAVLLQDWLLEHLVTRAQLDDLAQRWFGATHTLSHWTGGAYHG